MRDRFQMFVGFIQQLNRSLQRIKDIEMKRFGLRAGHAMCLYQLDLHPNGLTSAQLTALCGEDKGAISRLLAELMKKELVHCTEKQIKNYRAPYFLTERGKELAALIRERVDHAVSNGGEGLSDEERKTLYDALERVSGNLTEYWKRQSKQKETN